MPSSGCTASTQSHHRYGIHFAVTVSATSQSFISLWSSHISAVRVYTHHSRGVGRRLIYNGLYGVTGPTLTYVLLVMLALGGHGLLRHAVHVAVSAAISEAV